MDKIVRRVHHEHVCSALPHTSAKRCSSPALVDNLFILKRGDNDITDGNGWVMTYVFVEGFTRFHTIQYGTRSMLSMMLSNAPCLALSTPLSSLVS